MLSYGITEIQSKPSLIKEMSLAKIVDKRAHKLLGYFISEKYTSYIHDIIQKIEEEERIAKLHKIKEHTDWEFLESGIDDGL